MSVVADRRAQCFDALVRAYSNAERLAGTHDRMQLIVAGRHLAHAEHVLYALLSLLDEEEGERARRWAAVWHDRVIAVVLAPIPQGTQGGT